LKLLPETALLLRASPYYFIDDFLELDPLLGVGIIYSYYYYIDTAS